MKLMILHVNYQLNMTILQHFNYFIHKQPEIQSLIQKFTIYLHIIIPCHSTFDWVTILSFIHSRKSHCMLLYQVCNFLSILLPYVIFISPQENKAF